MKITFYRSGVGCLWGGVSPPRRAVGHSRFGPAQEHQPPGMPKAAGADSTTRLLARPRHEAPDAMHVPSPGQRIAEASALMDDHAEVLAAQRAAPGEDDGIASAAGERLEPSRGLYLAERVRAGWHTRERVVPHEVGGG